MQLSVSGVIVDGTVPTPPVVAATQARADLVVYQGVDTVIKVTVTGTNAVAFDLTGYTATMTVKDRLLPNQGTPQWSKTYSGTVLTNTLTFNIPYTDLRNMQLFGYWYDVFVVSGTGKKDNLILASTMTVNPTPGS